MSKILVIGAQNTDIFTKPEKELVKGDSNPAKIHMAFGGVGRNMAVNLKRLGHKVHLLSVFGDDDLSKMAIKSLEKLEIEIKESLFLKNSGSSIYLGIMDQNNDLHLGFHDMQIIDELKPDFLKAKLNYIKDFDLIVIDNNLSSESIAFLLNKLKSQTIAMDAVSAHKARKLKNHLHQISILKLNHLELNALSDLPSSQKQLEDLHRSGAQTILLSNQEKESYVSLKNTCYSQTPKPIENIVNSSGAGDAFLSAYMHGLMLKKSEEDRLKMANFAAGVTLSSEESTSPELCSEILEKTINE